MTFQTHMLTSTDPVEFAKEMEVKLNEGWKVQGSSFLFQKTDGVAGQQICQLLVKASGIPQGAPTGQGAALANSFIPPHLADQLRQKR